jgi:O-methyltransferase
MGDTSLNNTSVPLQELIALYLDLMKRCLTDFVYISDPFAEYGPYGRRVERPRWKEWLLSTLDRVLRPHHMRIFEAQSIVTLAMAREERARGKIWPARAHTMIGLKRLDNLQFCVEQVLRDGVPGDLIETGVWRGGACIFMRAILQAYGDASRMVWVADSFAGLPPPSAESYPADMGDLHHTYNVLAVSRETVENNFAAYGLLDDQVCFLQGWFKDTLPEAPIRQLAVMRLDGDMYESTIQALDALYDRLSPGGFVIIDDYFLEPCARAVQEFRDRLGIADPIHDIDGMGRYWRRSAAA